jgi:hypothetical protein
MSHLGGPHNPFAEKLKNARQLKDLRGKAHKERADAVIEHYTTFWEKVSLFDAGVIALSINFAAGLHAQHWIRFFPVLAISWCLLALSMAAAFLRNRFHANYAFYATQASYIEATVKVAEAEIEFAQSGTPVIYSDSPDPYDPEYELKMATENREKAQKALVVAQRDEKRMEWWSDACERIAAAGMVIGVLVLIIVAVVNLKP